MENTSKKAIKMAEDALENCHLCNIIGFIYKSGKPVPGDDVVKYISKITSDEKLAKQLKSDLTSNPLITRYFSRISSDSSSYEISEFGKDFLKTKIKEN